MRQRLRSHLTYANVMATLAVFLVVTGGTAVALQGSNTVFTYANVTATLALFLVLSGGTAVALSGSNTVFTDDIANDNFNSPTQGQGGLTAPDLRANSVGASEVANNSLTNADIKNLSLGNGDFLTGSVDTRVATNNGLRGADIQDGSLTGADIRDQSGVDTCTHGSARFGELCVGQAKTRQSWGAARNTCRGLELRLPSLGEAQALATNHNLPTVTAGENFWTDEFYVDPDGTPVAFTVNDDAHLGAADGASLPLFTNHASPADTVCVTTPTN
jgi:hypothetical protein